MLTQPQLQLHSRTQQTQKGAISIAAVEAINLVSQSSLPHVFEVVTAERTYYLQASSEEERQLWVRKLRSETLGAG